MSRIHPHRYQASPYRPFHVSAGCIVLDQINDPSVLVLYDWRLRPSLPKGTVDNGETLEITAVRETKEEAGLEVEIIDFVGTTHYQSKVSARIGLSDKTVHYFLAFVKSGRARAGEHYLRTAWVELDRAIELFEQKNPTRSVGPLLINLQDSITRGIYGC